MAVRTTAPAGLRTQIFWDPNDAPKTAEPYCHIHGPTFLQDLATVAWKQ